MKFKSLAAALTLAVAGPAMASTCTSTSSLGVMGPPGSSLFGNSFSSAQSFSDCYSFTLNSSAQAWGWEIAVDPLSMLNIDVKSVSLTGGGLSSSVVDFSPSFFSFGDLLAGTYELIVAGNVTSNNFGFALPVGYGGVLSTSMAAAVPEPETYAMLLLGLGTIGWVVRRRRRG